MQKAEQPDSVHLGSSGLSETVLSALLWALVNQGGAS
jgi:hypothetical protein